MKNNLYVTLLLLILSVLTVSAQENLPYTRFGVGDIRTNSSAEQRAWGNMDAAFQDQTAFDITNPASLAWLRLTVLQAGLYGRVTDISSTAGKQGFGYTSPDYLTLGVPIKKGWGISLGLLPYSTVSYDLFQQNGATGNIPSSTNEFIGSGTLYQVYLASGWAIKNFAFGVSGAYIFGSLFNTSQQIFSDSVNGFNSNYQLQRKVSSFKWNAGVQYDLVITTTNKKTGDKKKQNHLVFGLSGHTAINANAEQNYLYNRFYINSVNNTQTPYDTLAAVNYQKGKIVIPAELNAGVIWKHKDNLKIGFNYYYNAFNTYKSFGNPDSTCNSYKASVGAEYIPSYDLTQEEGYFRRVKYRLGAYYGNYFLSFDNKPLVNYGVTFGFGLPLRKVFSDLDLAFDIGSLGTTDNNLVKETYFRGTLGIKFSDKWFLKRKYD